MLLQSFCYFSFRALNIFLVLLQSAIGHENGALGRGQGRADIEDYASLLGVIGGDGVAKNIGNAAQDLALLHEITAVNVVQPAACFEGFEIDEVFHIARGMVTGLDRQGEHLQLAQNVAHIVLVGFDILVQAQSCAAAFNEDGGQASTRGVIIGDAGGEGAHPAFKKFLKKA